MRLKTKKQGARTVSAESGTCSRCTQPIKVGDRMANERGNAAHRDCIRLHIVMPRQRTPQESAGWGASCDRCGQRIVKPDPWTRQRVGSLSILTHKDCPDTG